jgi:hypothetical protein
MILPRQTFTLASPLYPDQAVAALRAVMRPPGDGAEEESALDDSVVFTGRCDETSFELTRVIRYRNSFLPVVSGRIEGGAGPASRIHVVLRLYREVRIFMAVWLGGVALGILATLGAALHLFGRPFVHNGREPGFLPVFIACGLFCAGFGLMHGAFHGEAKKARAFLVKIFKAEVEAVPGDRRAI